MSLCDRLAAFFRARSGEWIDGLVLATVAGSYAWRSRISNLRRPPYGMTIVNRVRTVEVRPGQKRRISEYLFTPEAS